MNREQHDLNCLAEECAEVAQRASKAIRFGLDEIQPGQLYTNKARLEAELGDLMGVIDALGLKPSEAHRKAKKARLNGYFGYSKKLGRAV